MRNPWLATMLGVWHDSHPHWVVDHGCYSITLRCKGSLPVEIRYQLKEIGEALKEKDPADSEAEAMRRRHFAILDNTLDACRGPLPFTGKTADELHNWLADYSEEGLTFAHWVIMPNHWHLITHPITFESIDQARKVWRRFKARSARFTNQVAGRTGPLWQSSLYDRWIRNEAERTRWIRYLQNNPVKARLAKNPEDYPYLH
jgi:REP element-mobilizing transposase RayT